MQKILVIVDPQNDFITGVLGSEYARSIVPRIVNKINNFDGRIFVTLDTHNERSYPMSRESLHIPIHCTPGTEGYEVNPEIYEALRNHGNVAALRKRGFSLLENDMITMAKVANPRDPIEVIGYVTDICVISNALLIANTIDVDVVVDASCCAGTSKEAHDAAIRVMKSCLIEVTEGRGSDEQSPHD